MRQKLHSEGEGSRRNPWLRCWGRLDKTCIQRMDTPSGNTAHNPRISGISAPPSHTPRGGTGRLVSDSLGIGVGIPVFKRHGNTRQILTCFLLFPTENYWAPSPRYTCGRVERTLASEDLGTRPGLAPASQVGRPWVIHFALQALVASPTCLAHLIGRFGKITRGYVWTLILEKYILLQKLGRGCGGVSTFFGTCPASLKHRNAYYSGPISLHTFCVALRTHTPSTVPEAVGDGWEVGEGGGEKTIGKQL